MNYRIAYQEQVYDEINHAYEYYEKEQNGLGLKLLDAIGQAELDIIKNPLGYQVKHEGFRSRTTWPFPYVLIYEVNWTRNYRLPVFLQHTKSCR